jgi:hypothetical protein
LGTRHYGDSTSNTSMPRAGRRRSRKILTEKSNFYFAILSMASSPRCSRNTRSRFRLSMQSRLALLCHASTCVPKQWPSTRPTMSSGCVNTAAIEPGSVLAGRPAIELDVKSAATMRGQSLCALPRRAESHRQLPRNGSPCADLRPSCKHKEL